MLKRNKSFLHTLSSKNGKKVYSMHASLCKLFMSDFYYTAAQRIYR